MKTTVLAVGSCLCLTVATLIPDPPDELYLGTALPKPQGKAAASGEPWNPPFGCPESFDFRHRFVRPRYQIGPSCASDAAVAAMECFWYKTSGWEDKVALSTHFAYLGARQWQYRDRTGALDLRLAGVSIASAFHSLESLGCPPEEWFMGHDVQHDAVPAAHVWSIARNYRVTAWGEVEPSFVKPALLSEVGVCTTFAWFSSHNAPDMFSTPGGGPAERIRWHAPDHPDIGARQGQHDVVLCGWDDSEQVWIARMAAGPYYADEGFVLIPFDYWPDYQWGFVAISHVSLEP